MKQIFNVFYLIAFIYSISLSAYVGWWILRDWKALDYSHNVEKNYDISIHHRINLAGEAPVFLLLNCLTAMSVIGLNINNRQDS
ncbi:hypothetical protein WEU38_03515 [Cyanobacterium aponinum AL20118]|uniref:Uncharacterized protein n=3 Tax=Cyanobacterium aponinum TaxID=379064 RepID=K9Z6C1_CYAAP|nr:hypothetical protein [Cyanobacterium aponinum]AFZ53958.1 hypothetical protein Cyan10605_1857 [Cyanobacterium aponinum PCC 10605]MTF39515.1 hypothetical protein [Cyanobacterium aponinum 0216]PHV61848.1 hypothetical protein CSQ80_13430 [Cyanobacterium aponinum IPPAS B-1201]WPF89361.1 hypothetical protein SAY89_03530 [Cyanobacterium aponinum AL20115]